MWRTRIYISDLWKIYWKGRCIFPQWSSWHHGQKQNALKDPDIFTCSVIHQLLLRTYYVLGFMPETRNTLVSESNIASVLMGEILEKIMHKNNRITYLIILMFFFVDVWFQISFFHGRTLTKGVLPLSGFWFLVSSLSRGKSYKLEVSLTVCLSLLLCLTHSPCRCLWASLRLEVWQVIFRTIAWKLRREFRQDLEVI